MPAKKKLDLYQVHKTEYVTPRECVLVKVGPAKYLAIEGQGAPGSEEFQAKIGALYNVTFTIKMAENLPGRITPSANSRGFGGRRISTRSSWNCRKSSGAGN